MIWNLAKTAFKSVTTWQPVVTSLLYDWCPFATNKQLTPNSLATSKSGLTLTFGSKLDGKQVTNIKNYEVKTWALVRSSAYGSDRYDVKTLDISEVEVSTDGQSVSLFLNDIAPTDVMTVSYDLVDLEGNALTGKVQNTIHNLSKD